MVKHCLLVLALAATHSPVAPGMGAPGGATPAITTARPHSHAAADKYQTWRIEAAATLSARADANSLATAAALRYAGPAYGAKAVGPNLKPSALELAASASELAPQNARIVWLHLQ